MKVNEESEKVGLKLNIQKTKIMASSSTTSGHHPFNGRKSESESEVIQSCPTLCDPVDCSLPGSSVHEIFQARVLEWVAAAFSEVRVNRETKKTDLKLNIKKTKIMASSPISSRQIEGEKAEAVTDFIFLGSKITVDGDCSHEIFKRP